MARRGLPWLKKEKAFIKMAVEEKGIPFLGLCLGHQLLAESLGGVVGKSETAEVGVMEVQLTEDGATGILFDGIPEKISCLQWHGAEIKKLPVGAKVLATSKDCAVQAMSWGLEPTRCSFTSKLRFYNCRLGNYH